MLTLLRWQAKQPCSKTRWEKQVDGPLVIATERSPDQRPIRRREAQVRWTYKLPGVREVKQWNGPVNPQTIITDSARMK
jgi:hypothetical protein